MAEWRIELIDSHLRIRLGERARQLHVSPDVLLSFCATAPDPPDGIWELWEYVEYGENRVERFHEERARAGGYRIPADVRELYRQIGPGVFEFQFRDLHAFSLYLELNHLRLSNTQVREM